MRNKIVAEYEHSESEFFCRFAHSHHRAVAIVLETALILLLLLFRLTQYLTFVSEAIPKYHQKIRNSFCLTLGAHWNKSHARTNFFHYCRGLLNHPAAHVPAVSGTFQPSSNFTDMDHLSTNFNFNFKFLPSTVSFTL